MIKNTKEKLNGKRNLNIISNFNCNVMRRENNNENLCYFLISMVIG